MLTGLEPVVRDERCGTREATELLAVCLVLNLRIDLELQHQTKSVVITHGLEPVELWARLPSAKALTSY